MKPSQIAQIIIGVILGLTIIGGVVIGVGYVYLNRFSQVPAEPKFTSDAKPKPQSTQPKPYPAVVTYPDGLFLRKEQSTDAEVIKVLEAEESVTVLETSSDKKWQKLKADLEGESVEGWVSMGNTERVASNPPTSASSESESTAAPESDSEVPPEPAFSE